MADRALGSPDSVTIASLIPIVELVEHAAPASAIRLVQAAVVKLLSVLMDLLLGPMAFAPDPAAAADLQQ